MKIAVIKGSSLGDILTGIPALRSLREHCPDAKIILVHSYEGSGLPLIRKCPYIDEDVMITGVSGMKNILRLRKEKIDVIIDGFPNTRLSSLLTVLIGAKKTASYLNPRNALSFVYDVKAEEKGDAVQLEQDILALLGVKGSDKMEIMVPEKCKKMKRPFIAVNAGKDDNFCRTWVGAKWAELIRAASKKYGCRFVLVGGKDGMKKAREIEKIVPDVANLVGKTTLDEMICIISQCDAFISVNGGPMHVAAALGKKQIVLNGPSLPQWNPHNPKAVCLGGRKFCDTKCNDNYCKFGDARCVKWITPAQVLGKLDAMLTR
ncbi:MAG: glycosyltransferase family 9 protein [Candidatus Aenigmarchaeota archaeon]|nr:glycosyltransferase family 9 protein [Candidatus Aenigmarchaeota archaeon]